MRNRGHGLRALLRRVVLVSGSLSLMVATGAPSSAASVLTGPASASTRIATSAVVTAASPTPTPTPSPTPKTTPNPTVTNPGPLPAGAPRAGVKPSTGASRLQRARAAGTAAAASVLPPGPCTLAGTTRTCELWATTGTLSFPGSAPLVLPVWGFSTSGTAGTGQVPGPVLVANAGETVRITVHNQLPRVPGFENRLSIGMPASAVAPDVFGIEPGDQRTYNFGSLKPGTYLYEAGITQFGPRQVRMGLSGILVVRPSNFAACNCAYGNPASDGFVDEATLLLNEFDPAFNLDPFGADPLDFSPSEFAINGVAYDPLKPAAGKINVAAGDVLLLRYANLTDHERGMTIGNERQNILADDSYVLTNPADVATKWLNPGQVSDSFITIDPSFPLNTRVPVYDAGLHFNNGADTGLGGMFTYLDVMQSLAGSPSGPVTSAAVSPANNSGIENTIVTGTITASTGATLQDAEWFLDDPGVAGTAPASQHFAVSGALFNYSFTIPSATLNTMLISSINRDGDHIVWVHAKDSSGTGTWGVVSGDVLTYNATGPVIGALSAHVSPTNGRRPTDVANGGGPLVNGVAQNARSNDLVVLGMAGSSLSNFIVTGAEYCIDVTPCSQPVPIVLTPPGSNGTTQIDSYGAVLVTPTACVPVPSPPGVPAPGLPLAPGGGSVVSLCGTVPASVLQGLSLAEGAHTLFIRACEQVATSVTACAQQIPARFGSFNADASIQFVVDRTGPAATGISLAPDPNNGRQANSGNLNFLDSLQVASTLTDPLVAGVNSNIAYGEVFVTCSPLTQASCQSISGPIDPVTKLAPPDGTGAEMIPSGAKWDSPTKLAYAYIPLPVLTSYPEGHVRFWIHAQDLAGNFGPWAFVELTYDRTPPVFDSPALPVPPAPPTSIACTGGCTITFTAHDPVSGGVNSNIVQAEWFIDQGARLICEPIFPGCTPEVVVLSDPGFGNGTPITIAGPPSTAVTATITLGPQPAGAKIVFRVRDAAGNWSMDNLVVTT